MEDVDVIEEVVDEEVASDASTRKPTCRSYTSTSVQTLPEPKGLITIEKIRSDPVKMASLTGFEDYTKFRCVLQTLGPAAHELDYRWSQINPDIISVENQFLLTVMKLRRHYTNQELAMFFEISLKTVSNIFVTWINFMYFQWKELNMWPEKDIVAFFTPLDFNLKFPGTRIIVDGTEIPLRKPKNPDAQQKTWSTYKNQNTLKVLVGCTPGGFVAFYISEAYGGSASDRLLCERSPLMTNCDPGDVIMSDKGFNVQDIFAPYDISVNIPTFMKGKNQLHPRSLAKDKKIASKRVLVERVIGLAKTYQILCNPLNDIETALGTQIIFICFMLCNFRGGIVPETR